VSPETVKVLEEVGKLLVALVGLTATIYGIVSSMLKGFRRELETISERSNTALAAHASQWREELSEARSEHDDMRFKIEQAVSLSQGTRERQSVLEAEFRGWSRDQDELSRKVDALHTRLDAHAKDDVDEKRQISAALGAVNTSLQLLAGEVRKGART
jgi:predicted  nucleic acid-binding Zn-ribbon protein